VRRSPTRSSSSTRSRRPTPRSSTNRVDETILFGPLTLGEIEQIVDLQMEDLRKRLADRQITIELSGPARADRPAGL
jgi:ATP-dependent Clp protease ATP-binding subunit ClpA